MWPGTADYPGTSNLNWTAGQTIANSVSAYDSLQGIVWIGNAFGQADVVMDLSGWYG